MTLRFDSLYATIGLLDKQRRGVLHLAAIEVLGSRNERPSQVDQRPAACLATGGNLWGALCLWRRRECVAWRGAVNHIMGEGCVALTMGNGGEGRTQRRSGGVTVSGGW